MIRLWRTFCWLVLACALAGGRAEAHASLVEAVPADGSVVATAPASVRLRFNEPVSPLVMRLVDAKGETRSGLQVEARDDTLTIVMPGGLPNGTQVVSYRVISSDGHPVAGSLLFSIGEPTRARLDEVPAIEPRNVAIWLARATLYVGLFAGAGGAFFAAWIAPGARVRSARAVVEAAAGVGLLAAVLSVGLQGLDALDAPLSGLGSGPPWREGFQTSFGRTAVSAILALLCAWLALRDRAARLSRPLALIGLGGAGLALALSGHASTASPEWLTRPAVFIHGVAAAFWVGALAPLALLVRERRGASLPVMRRFSAVAVPLVGVMVLAGLALGVVQVETPAALLSTAYGRVFIAKMLAVIGLLALAALNRQRLTPALASGEAGSRRLVRSIAAEIALALAILGLVALWRFTPPPRALAAAAREPAFVHIHTAPAMVDLSMVPGKVGPAMASLVLQTGGFGPLDPKEVTLTLANPSKGIEPFERRAERTGDGTWRIENIILPTPGIWQVRVNVLITDFDKASLEGAVEIRP